MKKIGLFLLIAVGLASCEHVPGTIGDAKQVLHTFCTLKKTDIAQVLLTPAQLQAGRIVCEAIGDPFGT